jgi:HPt (histidine-containing phosphotransfer) domain-containing protein
MSVLWRGRRRTCSGASSRARDETDALDIDRVRLSFVSEGGDAEALVAAAQAEYASRLPDKLAALRAFVGQRAWTDARRAAHKLRGSAGVYGFSAVGDAAGALEDLLESSDDEAPPASALDSIVTSLAREIDRAVRSAC